MISDEKYELTENQVAYYKQNGFLIIEQLLTLEECDEINKNAVDILLGKVPLEEDNDWLMEPSAVTKGLVSNENPDPGYLFKIGHRLHVTDPIFRKYAMHMKITDALNKLIGPEIMCVQSMYIDKPKNIGVGQPYHQDSHYIRMVPDTLLGVWIALDDVDENNGCLHIIPGSHHEPVHPHEEAIEEAQRIYIEVRSARERPEVACRLRKGGAVIFPGTMLHRSGNNLTKDHQRRAVVLHYANALSKQSNPPKINRLLQVRKSLS